METGRPRIFRSLATMSMKSYLLLHLARINDRLASATYVTNGHKYTYKKTHTQNIYFPNNQLGLIEHNKALQYRTKQTINISNCQLMFN